MDVVALVPGLSHVCTRYRVAQYERHLAERGIRLRLEPIAPNSVARLRQFQQIRRDQVVLLVRKLLPVWQVAWLRHRVNRLIFDFDDAIYTRDSFHARPGRSWTREVRFQAVISLADMVLAGNRHLAAVASRRTKSNKVHVVPTTIDADRYRTASHESEHPPRLVWIGSASTLPLLEDARPVLDTTSQSLGGVRLRAVSDQFPRFDHVAVEPVPWSQEVEVDSLQQSHVGISWLRNDEWCRGKCGLKVLQYMATGLPVVANPVGVHMDLVDGDSGFLPRSLEDWRESLRLLLGDSHLRRQMGGAARNRLLRSFTTETWGPILADLLGRTTR